MTPKGPFTTISVAEYQRLKEALAIAWKTLDQYKHLVNTSDEGTGCYPIEDAMRRIEELGK